MERDSTVTQAPSRARRVARIIVRGGLAATLIGAGAVAATGAASAAGGVVLACTSSAAVHYAPTLIGGKIEWTLAGKGSCSGDGKGTYFLDYTGTGSSQGQGPCDGNLAVQNLDLNISGTLTNASTLITRPLIQHWSAPVTTFPIVTPFLISGANTGAGVISTHIFAVCPPGGSDVANITFAFTP